MDGLLIDSIVHWINFDNIFFAERGVKLTPDVVRHINGRSMKEGTEWLKEKFGWSESVEEILIGRENNTKEIYDVLSQPMPGANELIQKVAQTKLKQAIASSAGISRVETIVNRFGWGDNISELVGADHVNFKSKSAPGIYLHTAEKIKAQPDKCVVFEDTEVGLLSAKAAGMKCVAVLDDRWSVGDYSSADLITNSLLDEKIIDFLNI